MTGSPGVKSEEATVLFDQMAEMQADLERTMHEDMFRYCQRSPVDTTEDTAKCPEERDRSKNIDKRKVGAE